MEFRYLEIPTLPVLSWCARVNIKNGIIIVMHGTNVEINNTWFYEGAWDGPADEAGFATSCYFCGTGARIIDGGVEFVSPSHPFRGLAISKFEHGYLVSNSLVFIISQIGDKPDINYLDYYPELHNISQTGFTDDIHFLKMANGGKIRLDYYCNIKIINGNIQKTEKIVPEPPENFDDYRSKIITALARIKENATDTSRLNNQYNPLVSLSRGYDSVACAALASQAGWKNSFTMVPGGKVDEKIDDDGTPIAKCLGLSIEKCSLNAWNKLKKCPEAEFAATAWSGVLVRFSGMEEALRNSLLILGIPGGLIWNPKNEKVSKTWKRPGKLQMGGESLWEFTLRTGIITVYPVTFMAVHSESFCNIMSAEEMKPWTLGGEYDKPIPRRIAEEAGVPRELFGQYKMATAHIYPKLNTSVNGHNNFISYLRKMGKLKQYIDKPDGLPETTRKIKIEVPTEENNQNEFTQKLITLDFQDVRRYFFHWGVKHVLPRYKVRQRGN